MGHGVAKIWTAPDTIGDSERLSCAISMIAARKALHGPLSSAILHDTALEILLQLFIAVSADQYVSVGQLAKSTAAPRSVIVRWLKVLECARTVSINDGGTENPKACLSAQGIEEMNAALSAVIKSQITLHFDRHVVEKADAP